MLPGRVCGGQRLKAGQPHISADEVRCYNDPVQVVPAEVQALGVRQIQRALCHISMQAVMADVKLLRTATAWWRREECRGCDGM